MSFVTWGHSFFGRTDAVDGVGKVATRFWHFMMIPLVPRGSWWITEESWSWRTGIVVKGRRIPVQGKSVLLGYLRGWSVAGALVGMILANDHPEARSAWTGFAIISAAVAAVVYLPVFRRASPEAEERWRDFMTESGNF